MRDKRAQIESSTPEYLNEIGSLIKERDSERNYSRELAGLLCDATYLVADLRSKLVAIEKRMIIKIRENEWLYARLAETNAYYKAVDTSDVQFIDSDILIQEEIEQLMKEKNSD